MNKIPSLVTRLLNFSYRRTVTFDPSNPQARTVNTKISVGGVLIFSILAALPKDKLEYLGSIITKKKDEIKTGSDGEDDRTQFSIILSNFGCNEVDLTDAIVALKALPWVDDQGLSLEATPYLDENALSEAQLLTLLSFRKSLPKCSLLEEETVLMLNKQYPNESMKALLADRQATDEGDFTSDGGQDHTEEWAKGLINRITTGGPNGSMAGEIAVNFMNNVTVPAVLAVKNQLDAFARDDPNDPTVAVIKDAVDSAALSTAQGLSSYLDTKIQKQIAGSSCRQKATVVKGIRDSMPSTGKTVAQLAVFNALGNPEIAKLDKDSQLRVAYTVANSTRSTVEALGNHVADLYQSDSIPDEEELAAIGVLGIGGFLASIGATVAKGVMQVAPVVLSTIANSVGANNALGSTLPPRMLLALNTFTELDVPTKITLASRIVNGKFNSDSTVVTDKAVGDLANRTSTLGAQAALDTYTNTADINHDDPQTRKNFRDVALAISNLSPTFSNVTDIGATDLVTDSTLKHSDSLRQNALEAGMRSCANMIAENPSAEILHKVHLLRLKSGRDVHPRGFADFLKTAVPIAANIASTALPALLSIF